MCIICPDCSIRLTFSIKIADSANSVENLTVLYLIFAGPSARQAFTANDRGHVRTITLRLAPTAACEFHCKCKQYFASRPGPRTPTGFRQATQTVFQQEHAAYDRALRQSPPAAAEWAKPREIRRGTRSSTAYAGRRKACEITFKPGYSGPREPSTGPPRPGAPGHRKT